MTELVGEITQNTEAKIGDTVRFVSYKFDDDGWVTDKLMKVTGKLFLIEPKCLETNFPKYHVKRNGKEYWYSGPNLEIIKAGKKFKMDLEDLWGSELYKVFAEHINKDGWLTADWGQIIEDEIPKWDKDFNDNPLHGETYSRMYNLEYEVSEDEKLIRPLPHQFLI